jgi:hypothetical protein
MTVRKFFVGVVGMSALLGGGPPAASAQEMTERYIPVGQSPGLSGKYTVIGKIQTINVRDQTVAIVGTTGSWSAKITERTKIWLDRSKLRLTNRKGTFSDLRQGVTVEVKHEDHRRGVSSGPAEWIKVQILASP